MYFVHLAQSVKSTEMRCKTLTVYLYDEHFFIFLDSGIFTLLGFKYQSIVQIIFVHIFSQKKENIPFFVEHSIFVNKKFFSPTLPIRARKRATDILPLFVLMLNPVPLSPQPKESFLQPYNRIY